ncbi:hypothetical protein QAD02_009729 [Eretmocerus hayati]|uniref:Uncharacterized protein n=1 Tax=Eretmocerus hayati TaxID=131215 RepID=A0ACC2NBK2_9HYME|nr:hypothetical protein QAD02_009729 [Eretmocerus hayati]
MSDLINFDGPDKDAVASLPSPLIPSPESPPEDAVESTEAGPQFPVKGNNRGSLDNNPFDAVMKKVTEYEKNKEDPFERVVVNAMGSTATEEYDCFAKPLDPPTSTRSKILNKTDSDMNLIRKEQNRLVQEDNDISIITDLNNTNLISDTVDGIQIVASWSCDKTFPDSGSANADLSILNNSGMDCSLLDHSKSEMKELHVSGNNRARSNSYQSFAIPPQVSQEFVRRSLSVSDALRDSSDPRDNTNNAHMSVFDNPMNNAFRRASADIDSSVFTSFERRTNNSSVFSSLSNVSTIPADSLNKIRRERFHSDNSVYSGISNLSIIPTDNLTLPTDSSGFCDTINKGFIVETSKLSSSATSGTTPSKKSDIIKKFYELKKRMSLSQSEPQKVGGGTDEKSVTEREVLYPQLVDVVSDETPRVGEIPKENTQIQTNFDNIISHEAIVLAEKFKKIVSTEQSNLNPDDDLMRAQPDFDVLPPSDDESVDNLIELSSSPVKLPPQMKEKPKISDEESQNDIKALEHEFIEQKESCKNAEAAALLLSLEKVLRVDDNPEACKVLGDLQKVLGINCESNAEILKLCIQNAKESPTAKNHENASDLHTNVSKEGKQKGENMSANTDSPSRLNTVAIETECNKEDIDCGDLNEDCKVEEEPMNRNAEDVVRESNQNSDDPLETQDLTSNFLQTLNQIVNDKNEDVAVDILKSLSTVLDMATKLRTKSKSKIETEIKGSERRVQKRSSYSPYSLCKSPRPKHLNVKAQNKSLETTPVRRSLSTHPTYSTNSLSLPYLKERRRSDLMNSKKRFPSDPGFLNPVMAKKSPQKKIESPHFAVSQPSFKTSKFSFFHVPCLCRTADPVKSRLKKTVTNCDVINKKGPMKAIIPLGNMQKGESASQRRSVTPLKPGSIPTIKIMSSTPKVKTVRNLKTMPAASSTPNPSLLTPQRGGIRGKLNLRNSMHSSFSTCDTSPKSLNTSRNSSRRMDRTMSPQRRSPTPKKEGFGSDSRLPRYSPRPMRVRNHSFSDLKTVKSQTLSDASKSSSEKSIPNRLVLSPLKNRNKLSVPGKSNSLSRFNFNDIQTGPEKENYL